MISGVKITHKTSFNMNTCHSLIHSLTHSFTHSLTHTLTSLTHSLMCMSLTHSLTHCSHSLTHSLLLLMSLTHSSSLSLSHEYRRYLIYCTRSHRTSLYQTMCPLHHHHMEEEEVEVSEEREKLLTPWVHYKSIELAGRNTVYKVTWHAHEKILWRTS